MSTDLPPEAFTKETLQEAFNWLQEQPEPVKATVHTPERLVSIYRKSQRLNDRDAPVSSKKFIDDLKNLASSLDQFSAAAPAPAAQPQYQTPPPQATVSQQYVASQQVPNPPSFTDTPQPQMSAPQVAATTQVMPPPQSADVTPPFSFSPPKAETPAVIPPTADVFHHANQPTTTNFTGTRVTQTETKKAHIEVTTKTENITTNGLDVDDTTMERIQKVRKRFNLGSDSEAMRLLISIGFEKFSQFP